MNTWKQTFHQIIFLDEIMLDLKKEGRQEVKIY